MRKSKGSFGAVQRFNSRGPAIPPQKDYVPTRPTQKAFGAAEIEAAAKLAQDSPEFIDFVVNVVNMPEKMAPAVADAISQGKWKISPNPLGMIRTGAHQAARRMDIQP